MTERLLLGRRDALSHYVGQHHLARYRFAVERLVDVDGLILDIACGTGYGTSMLGAGQAGRQVVGLDISPDAVAVASREFAANNVAFRLGDAERIPVASSAASAVVSFETIEHLRRPKAFLTEVARVLRPRGILIISTPNRVLASTLHPIRGRPNNPFHVFEYTPSLFRADLEKHFAIQEMAGQVFVLDWLALWPVQVLLKATCHAFRGLGAYSWIDRLYHDPMDVSVVPLESRHGLTPSSLVAECVRP